MVYQIYLKRSRIECVFKFLKDGMGWEDIQIQDFQGIQNLLSIFFLAAYLYEIKEQEVHDDFIILLAKIGGGKGVVSRHYIFHGIQQLVDKHRIDRILEEKSFPLGAYAMTFEFDFLGSFQYMRYLAECP